MWSTFIEARPSVLTRDADYLDCSLPLEFTSTKGEVEYVVMISASRKFQKLREKFDPTHFAVGLQHDVVMYPADAEFARDHRFSRQILPIFETNKLLSS